MLLNEGMLQETKIILLHCYITQNSEIYSMCKWSTFWGKEPSQFRIILRAWLRCCLHWTQVSCCFLNHIFSQPVCSCCSLCSGLSCCLPIKPSPFLVSLYIYIYIYIADALSVWLSCYLLSCPLSWAACCLHSQCSRFSSCLLRRSLSHLASLQLFCLAEFSHGRVLGCHWNQPRT